MTGGLTYTDLGFAKTGITFWDEAGLRHQEWGG